jgi:hypothetical protein
MTHANSEMLNKYLSKEEFQFENLLHQTPSYYVVTDTVGRPRKAEELYSYSYKTTSERSNTSSSTDPYSYRPSTTSSYSSTTERRNTGGPGGYSYSSERSSSYGGPGGLTYSSTSSGVLPHGTRYRHYSYRV